MSGQKIATPGQRYMNELTPFLWLIALVLILVDMYAILVHVMMRAVSP
jgi:uncharacterized membrane protein